MKPVIKLKPMRIRKNSVCNIPHGYYSIIYHSIPIDHKILNIKEMSEKINIPAQEMLEEKKEN